MAASATDYFQQVGEPGTATTLSAPGYTAGGTSINVGSTTNFPSATGVTFSIDEVETVDGEEVRVAGTYNVYRGTVATGTSINNVTWVTGDGDRDYAAGSSTRVYITTSTAWANRLVEGLSVSLDQDGTLKAGAVDNSAAVANDVIDSQHYVAGSIDTEHYADGSVTGDKYATENTDFIAYSPVTNTDLTSSSYIDFLTLGSLTVPSWATKAYVSMSINNIFANSASSYSTLQIRIGTYDGSQEHELNLDTGSIREYITLQDEVALSGTGSLSLILRGKRNSGTGNMRIGTYTKLTATVNFI